MFNKTIIIMMIIVSGSALSASEVTVNINGNITSNTCEVDSASAKFTVQMGTTNTRTFTQAGTASSQIPFNIKLLNCGVDASNFTLTFNVAGDTTNNDLLAIATGGATGLGIALYDAQGKQIAINKTSSPVTLTAGTDNTLNFSASYMSTAQHVTAGAADSTATFALTYE